MNILMNPNNQLTNDILSLLKSMNLEPAWMNKAEQFFDFSQEINFSLLNGTRIHSLELWNSAVSAKAKKIVSDIRQKNDFRYSDRYILFMDAINVTEFMVYRYFDFRSLLSCVFAGMRRRFPDKSPSVCQYRIRYFLL